MADLLGRYVSDMHAAYLPQVTPADAVCLHLGYPDPATFPVREIASCIQAALRQDGGASLQYCEEFGDLGLRETIVQRYSSDVKRLTTNNLIITHGTTEAIELVIRLFLNEGDVVLMEAPTYLWAIRVFRYAGARLLGIPTDYEGISIDGLRHELASLAKEGQQAKLLYLVPDFQNPQGVTMSLNRREALLALAEEHDLILFEDTPYFDLRYSGRQLPTLFDLDTCGKVLSARSFSKTIGPGIRLGWVMGSLDLVRNLVRMKQTGSCTLTSRAVARYVASKTYETNLQTITDTYRSKHDVLADTLRECCPEEIEWQAPQGGFYYWLKLPDRLDVNALFEESKTAGVLFLKGQDFFCDETRYNALRLSFSYESPERIRAGCRQLMSIVERKLRGRAG